VETLSPSTDSAKEAVTTLANEPASSPVAEPVVEIRELTKRFGRITAVDRLSFTVERGSLFGFLGPNGAGKSTTLYILAGLVSSTSGCAELFGQNVKRSTAVRDRIGVMIETPAFYNFLSARKNLEIVARLHPSKEIGRRRIDEVLDAVDLLDRAQDRVGAYSHGMKQRLGLAQAYLHRPELLILDEPSNGLDPEGNDEMWLLLRRLVKEDNATILVSSHLLYEVERYCERVAVINHGRLVACDLVESLLQRETRVLDVSFVSPEVCAEARSRWPADNPLGKLVEDEFLDNRTLRVQLAGQPIEQLTAWLRDQELLTTTVAPVRQTLRDLFMKLIASEEKK
jgi:ABC-2 type transport system ATP-binding protein